MNHSGGEVVELLERLKGCTHHLETLLREHLARVVGVNLEPVSCEQEAEHPRGLCQRFHALLYQRSRSDQDRELVLVDLLTEHTVPS